MEGNEYHLQYGFLYNMKKLCIPWDISVQLMRKAHTSRVPKNFGMKNTMVNMQRYVYWKNMQEQMENFVLGCIICSTRNPRNNKLILYMSFPVSIRPWERISMYFFGGLPMNRTGNEYLFVMIYCFIKMCVIIPYKKKISGWEETELFFIHVWVHFIFPTPIISN
jgi:hypothetical protein